MTLPQALARDVHYVEAMPFFRPIPRTPLFRALRALALVVVLLGVAFFLLAAAEARRLRVDRREIQTLNVPEEFDGTRIVFVADIHAGPQMGARRLSTLIKTVNHLNPDVLILGGDYVGGRLEGARLFYPEAAHFKASLGRYAVLGNHDAWEGAEEAREGLRKAGITLLENDLVRVERDGASIVIGGVEDLYTGHPDAVALARDVDTSDFAVLVSHNPDVFGPQLPESPGKWDLALSGHTHGGQVNLTAAVASVGLAPIKRHFNSGWARESGVPVLISNGVGTVTAPLRFFAQPEIHVITLRHGEGADDMPAAPKRKKAPVKVAGANSRS